MRRAGRALEEFSGSTDYEVSSSLARASDGFGVAFRVQGEIHRLRLPPSRPVSPHRGRELWKRTCFEAFFFERSSRRYVELNWNVRGEYDLLAFDDYRRPAPRADPGFEVLTIDSADGEGLASRLTLRLPPGRHFALSPTAILYAEESEPLHYALAHGDRPDFHRREVVEGLALDLGAQRGHAP